MLNSPPSLLFVAHLDGEKLVAKRVELDNALQETVGGIFDQQYQTLMNGVEEEIPFVRDWKPDVDELLTIPAERVPETAMFFKAVEGNSLAVAGLGGANPASIGVKALFTQRQDSILVQKFAISQVLSRRFLLFLEGDVYRRITEPAFVFDNSLAFVIENGLVKFKSLQNVRSILDMGEFYKEATEEEVRQFAGHSSFDALDMEGFLRIADQPSRKLISAILEAGSLEQFHPLAIQQAAKDTGLDIEIRDDKIVMPTNRRAVKELLRFLDESRYRGPLSGTPYIANSRKPVRNL